MKIAVIKNNEVVNVIESVSLTLTKQIIPDADDLIEVNGNEQDIVAKYGESVFFPKWTFGPQIVE